MMYLGLKNTWNNSNFYSFKKNIMTDLLRALILVPVITAVMQGIKQMIPEKFMNFMWIITCIVGILSAYWYVGAMQIVTMNNAMVIFGGIIAGLSASGLYEVWNNIVKALKPSAPIQ